MLRWAVKKVEEVAIGVTKLRRLSQKTSPQTLGADVSGYEYPGSIGSELVASASWSNDFDPKDSVLLRDEYNRVMQLERRLVFQTYVKPRLLANGCKESDVSAMQKTFNMSVLVSSSYAIPRVGEL